MDVIPDKRPLVALVEQAYTGKLCLPNFQRDFVWPRDQVADLIRSVLRRYFIGSLLLLRCDPQNPPFAPDAFRGTKPASNPLRPELLVLDGQQRLTAFLYALTAPDYNLKDSGQRRWFFIDLNLWLKDPDDDEIVFDRTKKELDGLDRIENQYARHILPCEVIFKPADFMKWRDGLDDWLKDNRPDEHRTFRAVWRDLWTRTITDFQAFPVPVLELPMVDDLNREATGTVCAIFEKLNSTGIELSIYDLLTARLYRHGIRLHELWKESCALHKRLNEWSKGKPDTNKFGVLILRTLSLLRDIDPKPKIMINLVPANFISDWRVAAAAIERALEIVTHMGEDGFGVFNRDWLPGYGLIPILAALRHELEERRLEHHARHDLRRWYWSNVFLERYSSAVESKSRKDYVEMIAHWSGSGKEPSVFTEAKSRIGSDGFSIRQSASSASSIYRGVFCLLALFGARDWRREENIALQELQDHHIFPKAYLENRGLTKQSEINTILNRTLISDETNNKIKAMAPADYVESTQIFPAKNQESLLRSHFISQHALAIMRQSTEALDGDALTKLFDAFCRERESKIVEQVRKVCNSGSFEF